ncbi:vWA domain-containing protein [Enterocloster bolteae]|uniref:vWA domain-containing protein n=1 Tax=Enterocloster bolteae TaxID=208479 RepID=UPI003AEF2CA2
MSRMKARIYCLIMSVVMAANIGMFSSRAEENTSANRFNVVFVIDASGSMNNTDSAKWRFEAMDLFLGLATDEGNRIGAVVFNDGIVMKQDIREISGKQMKEALSQGLRTAETKGDTDIGSAILTAAKMLDESRDAALPSAIILLSDGNTDLPEDTTGEMLQQSETSKRDAIARARQNGYPIYTICLNANSTANPAELSDIANATAGQFVEVGKAEDLKEVFAKFYNMIYSTETVNITDGLIPENGLLEIPFHVPSAGVEEVNIIISTLSPSAVYTIFQPSGIAYTRDELGGMTIQAKTFAVIKIPSPPGGEWKIMVNGIPGDAVKIDMVCNSSFSVKASTAPAGPDYQIGSSVKITAVIDAGGDSPLDDEAYNTYPAVLTIRRNQDDSEVTSTAMTAQGNCYVAEVILDEFGSYYGEVTVSLEGMERTSERVIMNLENTRPMAKQSAIKWKIKKMPFGKATEQYDISDLAEDAEDGNVTYSISSSDYGGDTVYLEDGTLNADTSHIANGRVVLTASDSQGESCDITVSITVMNIGGILFTILFAVLALIGISALIAVLKKNGQVFKGDIMVIAFDNNTGMMDVPQTIRPGKGKVPLARYLTEGGGVDLKQNAFMADKGTGYIWLISKSGLYSSNGQEQKQKKIRLTGGMEVTISRNRDLDCGLQITYMPDEM